MTSRVEERERKFKSGCAAERCPFSPFSVARTSLQYIFRKKYWHDRGANATGRQRKKMRSGETGSQLRHFTSWLMSPRNFAGGGSFSKPFFRFGVHHCTGPADLGSAYLSSSFLACMQMGVCRKKRMFVVLCVLSASWQDYLFEGAKGREWLCQQKGFIHQVGIAGVIHLMAQILWL